MTDNDDPGSWQCVVCHKSKKNGAKPALSWNNIRMCFCTECDERGRFWAARQQQEEWMRLCRQQSGRTKDE